MLNPILVSVVVLCALCLCKLNVLLSMLLAALTGGLMSGLGPAETLSILVGGFTNNAETALSYVLLGAFATAMSYTGVASILSKKIAAAIQGRARVLLFLLAGIACLSQNLIPVHIAFIPILIPPLLAMMNRMRLDRRGASVALAFGLKAPYLVLPAGFGLLFHTIVADNLTQNGMPVVVGDVWKTTWIIGVGMLCGLLFAVFLSYRKPRDYQDVGVDLAVTEEIPVKLEGKHMVTLAAAVITVAVQLLFKSLPIAALSGLLVMIVFGAVPWRAVDDQVNGGIRLMGFIAFVMLVAGGYAEVMKATGGVQQLVESALGLIGGSKLFAAVIITLIGLVVCMGIGTSFGTVPILAILYVPLCSQLGFSTAATILLITGAAAVGDAGSPASDTSLGPTSGLNADGQHDHIFDTCVPNFLHLSIPIMLFAIVGSQFI